MDEGIAAVIGAAVGAVAALAGAWINARSLRGQVKRQAVIEHGHWRRQCRMDAYEGFIRSATEALSRLEGNRVRVSEQHLSPEPMKDVMRSLGDAHYKVLLAGPDLMTEFAKEFNTQIRLANDMLELDPPVSREDEQWQRVGNNLFNLLTIFPLAARKVLDAPTPDAVPYPNEDPDLDLYGDEDEDAPE